LLPGAAKLIVACPSPGVPTTPVGAPGAVAPTMGVTTFEGADGGPVPTKFVAVTVNVYGVLMMSPVTAADNAPPDDAVIPPGLEVTV